MQDLAGTTIGRYQVVARIGRGGMAEVYKAYHQSLNRYVGIKVLHAHLIEDDSFIGRFEREARSIGQLRHPNIVQAIDFDNQHGMYYMVMEFIDGPTLKAEMSARQKESKPFSMEEVARIYLALGNALDYAHRRDMIHRDIKPANVMINQEGNVILTDFGIARIIGATTQFTQTGTMTGTPAYMSPEQGRGAKVDGRSDVYSLGVMLYEMVTGSVPFEAETPIGIVMKHVTEPLPPPRQVNANIPDAVEQVLLKALQKNPEDRYQTPGALGQAMRQAAGLPPGDNLQNHPLTIVAPPPKFDEAKPITGSIVKEQRHRTGSLPEDGPTMLTDTPNPTQAPFSSPAAAKPRSMVINITIAITALTIMLVGGGLLGYAFFVVMDVDNNMTTAASATNTPIVIEAITDTQSADVTDTVAVVEDTEEDAATVESVVADTPTPEPTIDTAATSTAEALSAEATATAEQMFSDITVATAIAATNEAVQEATTTAQEVIAATSTSEAIAEATAQAEIAAVAAEATADAAATATVAAASTATAIALLPTNTPLPTPTPTLPPLPTDTPTPERPALSGKLAFPVDNGAGRYDLYIVSMPDGNVIARVDGVHQPDFRGDGQKLVVNAEGGGFGENVYEISANGNIDRPVSSSPTDSYPSYSPDGGRIVYSNPQLAIGTDGSYHSYIFVQCSLLPPSQEPEQTCQDIARFGILVPAGQIGEIQGTHPVWAANDHIFYRGCNTWAGGGSCGIFTVASWGNKRNSNGETPRKILDGTSATPTDSVGNLLAYHANVGNWEAFIVGLDGAAPINISNGASTDGLPTISPDGQWVAFASDRSGVWAVYVVPTTGGEPTHLFDFPKANPWAAGGGREWQNQRMSWGP